MNQPSQTAFASQAPYSEHPTTHRTEGWQVGQFSRSPDTGRFLATAERNGSFEAVGLSVQGVQQPAQARTGLAVEQTTSAATQPAQATAQSVSTGQVRGRTAGGDIGESSAHRIGFR